MNDDNDSTESILPAELSADANRAERDDSETANNAASEARPLNGPLESATHDSPLAGQNPLSTILPLVSRRTLEHVPRLSIKYLFGWMTLVPLLLLAINSHGRSTADIPPAMMLIIVGMATAWGWILSGGILIVWHALRRSLWPLEPGERLHSGAATLVLCWVLMVLITPSSPGSEEIWVCLLLAPTGTTFFALALTEPRRSNWRRLLFVAGVSLYSLLSMVANERWGWRNSQPLEKSWAAWFAFLTVAGLILLVGGVVGDWRRGQARHWLHWSGVAVAALCFGGGAIGCIAAVVMMLVYSN